MKKNENKVYGRRSNKGIAFGIALMIIGVIFLGTNFGLIPEKTKNIIISWQMLLIFLGVINIFKKKFTAAVTLILIGSFFMLPKIVVGLNQNFVHVYWPLLLIAAGMVILIQRIAKPDSGFENDNFKYKKNVGGDNNFSEYKNGRFDKNSIFGGADHVILDNEFNGGELNAVFGGISLDLRRTNLPQGETYLEVNAVFGGVTIFVPEGWLIETHIDAVFGGFRDNRLPIEVSDKSKKLIIKGSCVFGGGELKN